MCLNDYLTALSNLSYISKSANEFKCAGIPVVIIAQDDQALSPSDLERIDAVYDDCLKRFGV